MRAILLTLLAAGLAVSAQGQSGITVTNLDDSGTGSLREALGLASAGDTIVFDAGLSGGTITLTSGHLQVGTNLTIDASTLPGGIIISGNDASRVFVISNSAATETVLDSLAIRDGRTDDGSTGASGGNGQSGGGIVFNGSGTLVLRRCLVTENRTGDGGDATDEAEFAGYGGNGGGIYAAFNTLVLDRTTVRGNRTGDSGAHLAGKRDSGGGRGGGLYCYTTDLTLIDSTIEDNFTGSGGFGGEGGAGGGIWIFRMCTLEVERSTISGNHTGDGGNGNGGEGAESIAGGPGGQGGGIYASQLDGATIENSTVALNFTGNGGENGELQRGFAGSGGGIFMRVTNFDLVSSTVVGNFDGVGNSSEHRGGIYIESGRITVTDSIVAGNRTLFQTGELPDLSIGVIATVLGSGLNLIGDNHSATSAFPDPLVEGEPNENGDLVGTPGAPLDPMLDLLLRNNGGPTRTFHPLPGSPAIDPVGGTTVSPFDTDQRGQGRIFGGILDIGAVEFQPDNGPLRKALTRKIKKAKRLIRVAEKRGLKGKASRLKKQVKRLVKRLRAL